MVWPREATSAKATGGHVEVAAVFLHHYICGHLGGTWLVATTQLLHITLGSLSVLQFGQQCLLARRLVERGVSFVTVNNTGWDKHIDLATYANRHPGDPRSASHALIPGLDKALGALIGDLSDRGMFDETLVLVMTDFGRTPKINSTGGRDHWPNCFSVAMAGGGVKGGQVIGESDALGEFVKDRSITPGDLSTTIYTLLGIDTRGELHTPDGRPVRIAPEQSKVIRELLP